VLKIRIDNDAIADFEDTMMKPIFNLTGTVEILITSENGDKLTSMDNVSFETGVANGNVINVFPDRIKQTIEGIGTSFTESSAFVLAHLKVEKRLEVMHQIFSEEGANFTLNRTHIGACDFCVEGKYSYADVKDDVDLKHFTIAADEDGFDLKRYPKIQDGKYDLLPMIKEAQSIKSQQTDKTLKIIASPWTAPAWMKDIEDWYVRPTERNGYNGTGGILKSEYQSIFADYFIKYLKAYKQQGVDIWGVTPVNEPLGNSGQWESMHFDPKSQNAFIKNHLGPKLKKYNDDLKLLVFDHSRDQLEAWADVIYTDSETNKYVDGAAVHWYESTYKVFEEEFDKVHAKYPDYSIIHTEGCIDDLGKDAPAGVLDPIGYKDKNWFKNDSFWWNDNASDWAYSVTWKGVKTEDHPIYTPVHRYARNIIISLNHWMSGWIDWNIVLDSKGGPNHVGNFCGAPIMIDLDTSDIYYTPIFYILAQFSKTIRPNDRVVQNVLSVNDSLKHQIYACTTINNSQLVSLQLLNTSKEPVAYAIQVGRQYANVKIPANALQTVRIQL